jgi:hypothetical protein
VSADVTVTVPRRLVRAALYELAKVKGRHEDTAARFDVPEHDSESGRALVRLEREDAARVGRLIEELTAALDGPA